MESEDHTKSTYGEICFGSVHSLPLGIFYAYPFTFSALLTNALRWLCELKIYPRYPYDIIVTKPYYTCYIITFADQTLLNLSLHYICALYCYCNELISYLEGQLLLTISHCILTRVTPKKLLVKQSLHVRVSNEQPINDDPWLIASWRGRKKVHRQLITDQLDCDASTSSWSYSTWKSLSSKQ